MVDEYFLNKKVRQTPTCRTALPPPEGDWRIRRTRPCPPGWRGSRLARPWCRVCGWQHQADHRTDQGMPHNAPLSTVFFQAEDGIRDGRVTGVQTCALPIYEEHRFGVRHKEQIK